MIFFISKKNNINELDILYYKWNLNQQKNKEKQ